MYLPVWSEPPPREEALQLETRRKSTKIKPIKE